MIPHSKLLAMASLAVAIAALAVGVLWAQFFVLWLAVALGALLVGATAASDASAIGAALQPYVGRAVTTYVWGSAPAGSAAGPMVLEGAFALSAALHLKLRSRTNGALHRVKVAQPHEMAFQANSTGIRRAKYVSWNGQRFSKGDAPAVLLQWANEQVGGAA